MTGEEYAPQEAEIPAAPTQNNLNRSERRGMDVMPALLTLDEAARILRVHRNTVNHERRTGRLLVVRVGRRVLIDPTDLRHYIMQRREVPPCTTTIDSMNTAPTGSRLGLIEKVSTSPGFDRVRDRSNAAALAQAILNKPK